MSDVFRNKYRELNSEEVALLESVKNKAAELYDLLPKLEDGRAKNREISLAMTKLEECVMWAVKGITQ